MHAVPILARLALATFVIAVGSSGTAQASFVTTSPDPFPPGSGFVQTPGCLTSGPLGGLCADNVTGLILSSSESFMGGNEFATLHERVTGEITDNTVLLGSFSVLGTLSLELFMRAGPAETGTFSATIIDENYLGMIDGIPLQITLDSSQSSTATVAITLLNEQNRLRYLIDSSFDIFSQISIEGGAPVPVGGFPVNGVVMPEPATILLMGLPLITLVGLRRPTA